MLEAGTEPSWQQLTFWKRWARAGIYHSDVRRCRWCLLAGPASYGPATTENPNYSSAWWCLPPPAVARALRVTREHRCILLSKTSEFSILIPSQLRKSRSGTDNTLMCPTDGRCCLLCRCRYSGLGLAI